jgi:dTDP-4-dehydrorhamnose reductase
MTGTPLRIGVIGAGGQLGTCLVREIDVSQGADLAFATTRADLDLRDLDDLDRWLDERLDQTGSWPLDVVINAAAHTKVDACESEPELAYQVNALAPAAWAHSLAERDVRLIHVSTDYVFAGDGDRPYREDDPTNPGTVYGKSKRAGEVAVLGTHGNALVVRTSWIFGPGRNFVEAILEQAEARRRGEAEGPLRVVDDQFGSPTSARDLAAVLVEICVSPVLELRNAKGLLHLRNAGETTWFGFAKRILELAGYGETQIEPVPTGAFKTVAPRPAYSVLDCSRAIQLGIELRDWCDALAGYLDDRGQRPAVSVQSADEAKPFGNESVRGVQ